MGERDLDLYPRALGPAWDALPEPVRRCHRVAPTLRATARFRITHGTSLLARLLRPIFGFPPAGDDVETRLDVATVGDEQEWRRDFAGRGLTTRQYLLADGRVAERRGPIELCFHLRVDGQELRYVPDGIHLRIGPLRVPLPWGPRAAVRAWAEPGESTMQLDIRITAPFVGTLITYRGPVASS